MAIKDRGKKKWNSAFFIPMQSKMLREMYREESLLPQPVLDEYTIEENENKLHWAYEMACELKVVIWKDGEYVERQGKVIKLDAIGKKIFLETKGWIIEKISFTEIIRVEEIENS